MIIEPSFIACSILGRESKRTRLTFGILGSSNRKIIVDGFFEREKAYNSPKSRSEVIRQ